MVGPDSSRLTRRTVLLGAAALLAAGTVPPRASAAAGTAAQIRSAAFRSGELLALTADGERAEAYAIRRLAVDADRRAGLGEPLAVEFPAGFHPHSMAARGETLWVTGAVDEPVKTITVDNRGDSLPPGLGVRPESGGVDPSLPDGIVDIDVYRARPALLRIRGDEAAYVDLPVPAEIRSGVATALALPGATGAAVVIEGCPDADLALITRSHLAVSLDVEEDEGRTWREHLIADALGEGYGTVLTAAGERLFAVTADGAGTQFFHSGGPDAALDLVGTASGAGRPMAMIVAEDGGASVFSEHDGEARESRFGTDGGAKGWSSTDCGCAGEVVAVQGAAGAWLELDADTVRAHGL